MNLSQELLGLIEGLPDSEIKQQAQALMGYLGKLAYPDGQTAGAKTWFDSKDFSAEEREKICIEYDKISAGKGQMVSSDHFDEGAADDADDKENKDLAKLIVEQEKLLEEVRTKTSYALDAANKFNAWLEKNEVQELLSTKAAGFVKQIQDNCDKVKSIV